MLHSKLSFVMISRLLIPPPKKKKKERKEKRMKLESIV